MNMDERSLEGEQNTVKFHRNPIHQIPFQMCVLPKEYNMKELLTKNQINGNTQKHSEYPETLDEAEEDEITTVGADIQKINKISVEDGRTIKPSKLFGFCSLGFTEIFFQ